MYGEDDRKWFPCNVCGAGVISVLWYIGEDKEDKVESTGVCRGCRTPWVLIIGGPFTRDEIDIIIGDT